mmetsp:Transcript_6984/g.20491  ORF Transcript_6984/g.20491 Transcript_6984/m.20491 type:complete len:275 (-) Transcript_6984:1955-2779(-)
MSDLANFVAATIRDKVVAEMQIELESLRSELREERERGKLVCITGPLGQPIYASAQFDTGYYDHSPELWKVEFTPPPPPPPAGTSRIRNPPSRPHRHQRQEEEESALPQSANDASLRSERFSGPSLPSSSSSLRQPSTIRTAKCALKDMKNMEIRIGGVCKARFDNGGTVEAFVNDISNNYDEGSKSGKVSIWFGGSSGIWLNISLMGIERDRYAALRDYDLSDPLAALEQFWEPTAAVTFQEVSFLISSINGAMERFGISIEPPPAPSSMISS